MMTPGVPVWTSLDVGMPSDRIRLARRLSCALLPLLVACAGSEVVALRAREGEEVSVHDAADGVRSDVIDARATHAVAHKPR